MNKIIISSDFAKIKEELKAKHDNIRFFYQEKPPHDFLLGEKEDNAPTARAVRKESYISESREKIIVIMANNFKEDAQNFLLKSFEEPPKNIKYIIISPSLNLILPTLSSRCIVEKREKKKQSYDLIDIKKLDLKAIYELVKENENINKEDLAKLITSIFHSSLGAKELSSKDLELFYKAYELSLLNTKSYTCLLALLLSIYEK